MGGVNGRVMGVGEARDLRRDGAGSRQRRGLALGARPIKVDPSSVLLVESTPFPARPFRQPICGVVVAGTRTSRPWSLGMMIQAAR